MTMTKKAPIGDDSIRVLKTALRTKLGISKVKPKKKPRQREDEEIDDDPPRRQKTERLGYAEMVSRK
jgi:hypothetical protein